MLIKDRWRFWSIVATSGALIGALTAAAPAAATPVDSEPVVRSGLLGEEWLADKDAHSMYSITKWAQVHDVWSRSDTKGQKITGRGIGVALIDSGITPVKGLTGAGKVINGPDLSVESQAPTVRYLDTYGHGTHMAGIIAGRDPEVQSGNENDSKYFVGVAPGAHLLNMKVAGADGAVDVTQVIAAIDWVVAHRNDPGLNIRVLNLSFGTDSLQDPRYDPLSHAVEAAWRKGIVVVVAAGNDGPTATRLAMPAANPYVIAVGGADPSGTEDRADDVVGAFSSRGSTVRKPDLVAPGKSVVSLRNTGSYLDKHYPGGLVPADPSQRFFRGSGSSQAAAVTSGAAALLLQQRPSLTPDQVKRLLVSTAAPMPKADPIARGAGQLDVKAAAQASTPAYRQTHPASLGTGSVEKSRGTAHIIDPANGLELAGEKDIMGRPWAAAVWSTAALGGTSWTGGSWNGTSWTGSGWTGSSWAPKTWSSTVWSGSAWSGVSWSTHTSAITGSHAQTWTGRSWAGRTWAGRTWAGRTWAGDYWMGVSWR